MSSRRARRALARLPLRARAPGPRRSDPLPATEDLEALEPRLVWIFGSPRSGSTWLLNLLRVDPRVLPVDEPGIGIHLGLFVPELRGPSTLRHDLDHLLYCDERADNPHYFFSRHAADVWRPLLRRLVLECARAQVEHRARRSSREMPIVMLKEPNGSQAADVMFELVPRARLIFLLRDGRDVVDSQLDASRAGTWGFGGRPMSEHDAVEFVEGRARVWLRRTEAVQRAFERLPPRNRVVVRYEDLVADTPGTLGRLLDWLGASVTAEEVHSASARLSFDALPADRKGPGRFARAATPGLWRENLTPAQQAAVHAIIGGKLEQLGYAASGDGRSIEAQGRAPRA